MYKNIFNTQIIFNKKAESGYRLSAYVRIPKQFTIYFEP